MKTLTKILLASASLILVMTYLVPIWSISLEAPQYPEGLGLYININSMVGHKPNDLQSINGLNHYIGMKRIEPDSILELKLMPWIILFMIISGLSLILLKKRNMIISWITLFVIIGIVGIYDFYKWGYDYGHNLDPRAIIKIPGMSYQPPLLGTKQLLNFTAHSFPDLGGYVIALSIVIASLAFLYDKRKI